MTGRSNSRYLGTMGSLEKPDWARVTRWDYISFLSLSFFLFLCFLSYQQDIINKKRCELDPTPGCTALEHIAPIYFAIFVLATQFVLLNVVVAVLMKHLEEAKEELTINSSQEEVLGVQVDGNQGVDAMQGHSSKDGDFYTDPSSPGGSRAKSESNNNPMVPVVGFLRQSNDSDSSLSSFDHNIQTIGDGGDLRKRLPPVDYTKPEQSPSLATLRLPPIGSQVSGLNKIGRNSEKIDDSSLSGLSSPETEKPAKSQLDGQISPRAPIYVMSEDSDLNDSNMEVNRDRSKVFRPVDRAAKSKGSAVRSPSPHSSSEDEDKRKKFSLKKPFPLRGKAFKKEPKATSVVSPKPESKPAKQGEKPDKPDSRWAAPVFVEVEKGKEEMRLRETEPKNKDDKDTSYQMQSYV